MRQTLRGAPKLSKQDQEYANAVLFKNQNESKKTHDECKTHIVHTGRLRIGLFSFCFRLQHGLARCHPLAFPLKEEGDSTE